MPTAVVPTVRVLAEAQWTPRADAHRTRVDRWVVPHLERGTDLFTHSACI